MCGGSGDDHHRDVVVPTMRNWILSSSVIKFGKMLPLWRLSNKSCEFCESFFTIRQNLKPTLAKMTLLGKLNLL